MTSILDINIGRVKTCT